MQKKFFMTMIKPAGAPPVDEPVYEDNGTFSSASSSTTIDVSYNSTINADDILIIVLINFQNITFQTPSGWTLISADNGTRSSAAFWKRATGSESGNVTCTADSSSALITGQMYRFSGCIDTGTPYESNVPTAETGTNAPIIPELTTTAAARLAVGIFAITDDLRDPSGLTDYTEQYVKDDEDSTTFVVNTQEIPTATTVPSDTASIAATENWYTYAFALIPAA